MTSISPAIIMNIMYSGFKKETLILILKDISDYSLNIKTSAMKKAISLVNTPFF